MYVVTGGTGFIGSNLLAVMESRGLGPLAAIDRCENEHKRRNIAKRSLAHLVPPEQTLAFLYDHLKEISAVIHLGALTSTTETDVERLHETNVLLSRALWHWCARAEVPFIYASSAATYGDGGAGFDDAGTPEALARFRPLNPYGQSKHDFDLWVADQWTRARAVPPQWAGLKFFNVYGPNEFHKGAQSSLVPQVYAAAAKEQAFKLFRSHNPAYPDGGQLRDFVFVDDCCDVILWLLENPAVSGLFNLGTGQPRTFLDLAQAVYRAAGREPQIAFRDTPPELRAQYQYFTQAKMDRLRRVGYTTAFTPLEIGVTETVTTYLSQPDPYR
ncbi:MAG: ADP-glyceromanno-heptose 6-epimerase [Rhodospirillaceae bacterium]|nr:ADP-glyceromanno-heptose 6-epimerase [Rhodospirillaceae bacterium]